MRLIPAYIAASSDEYAVPESGRVARLTIGLLPPVPLLRTQLHGVDCYVERWPESMLLHPAAERHAETWLSDAAHRKAVGL